MILLPYLSLLQAYIACATFDLGTSRKCPGECNGCLIRWGFYTRSAIDRDGIHKIRVARCFCKACGRTCSFLPPMLMRYCRWSLEWFREPLKSMVLQGKSLQKTWESLDPKEDRPDRPDLRRFRKVLNQLQVLADAGEKKVMAWIGHVAPKFKPDGVAETETVRLQTQKPWLGKWRKLGMLVIKLEGLARIGRALRKPEFPIMAVIHYCARGDWMDLVEGLSRST